MSKAVFKLTRRPGEANFDGQDECTVTINRESNIISVRPKHLRSTYELRLDDVANIIIGRCIMADLKMKGKIK